LQIAGHAKDSFTLVIAITAARAKLPLLLIAAENTAAVEESHFGDVAHHRTNNSESGWTTYDTVERWVSWRRGFYDERDSICVILASCSVHCQEATKAHAASIGIDLLFVLRVSLMTFSPWTSTCLG
jgi:hypothetical protein